MSRFYKYLLLLIANAAFFIIAAWLLPVMFEDNDDITMAWIASGVYSGIPDCHLVFINAILGSVLSFFYTISPSVEWYSVFFALVQILSMSVISSFIIDRIDNVKGRVVVSVSLYLFWLLAIVRFQFTTTAAIASFASTLLLLDRKFISGGILLTIAGMLRFSSAGLVGLLMTPALVWSYKSDIFKVCVPLMLVLLGFWGMHKADSLFYRTTEWRNYQEFNTIRGHLNDNPNLWRAFGKMPDGFPERKLNSVYAFAIDPSVITIDDLQEISNVIDDTKCYKKAKNIWPNLISRYWIWFLSIAFLFIILSFLSNNKTVFVSLMAVFLFWILLLSLVSLNGNVKFRVFLSSLLPVMCYSVFVVGELKKSRVKICLTVAAYIILWLSLGNAIFERARTIRNERGRFAEQVFLVAHSGNRTIIPHGADYRVEMYPPFRLSKSIEKCKFINPYCMMSSPLNARFSSFSVLLDGRFCILAKKGSDFSSMMDVLEKDYNIEADTLMLQETANYHLVSFVRK